MEKKETRVKQVVKINKMKIKWKQKQNEQNKKV